MSSAGAPHEGAHEGGGASSSPVVIVSDPKILAPIEAKGFELGSAFGKAGASSGADLKQSEGYRLIVDTITRDLAEFRAADRAAGVGMRFSHRLFDARWLSSPLARFELVGVVNRPERSVFAPEHCGEVRLIYRLAYRAERASGPLASRLPMTMNVVSFLPRDAARGCEDVARAWMRPAGVRERGEEASWMLSDAGPLAPSRRAAWKLKSVEVNFQSVRWPATVRPALGGHAEYVLRVFHATPSAPGLVAAPLENTPDVARLSRDRALRDELKRFLSADEALAKVDAGTLVVPDKFLATRAVSVAPLGLARHANRPYANLFAPAEFASLDLARFEVARSPAALLRRLDTLSCPGCHQSRSIAGFHFLGEEPPDDKIDAVQVPMSPHLHGELGRRRVYLKAIAAGSAPDERRPPAERAPDDTGRSARCGLGDPGFAAWACAAGLRCVEGLDPEVGTCEASTPAVGDGCEGGALRPDPNPHRDSARVVRHVCDGGRTCEASAVGFPGGMCAGSCEGLSSDATCGGIAILDAFNACLGRGTPFDRCVTEHTRPGALQACDFHTPCRDDYVCARTPSGGGCIPPYFLFQLRVDGHLFEQKP